MQETWVWSLCWKDPLVKDMATYSSILAWRIPWRESPYWWATVHGVAKSQTRLSNKHFPFHFALLLFYFTSSSQSRQEHISNLYFRKTRGERPSRRSWTRRTLSSPQSIFPVVTSNPRLAETNFFSEFIQHQSSKWCIGFWGQPSRLKCYNQRQGRHLSPQECERTTGYGVLHFFVWKAAQTYLWKGFHSPPLWIELL